MLSSITGGTRENVARIKYNQIKGHAFEQTFRNSWNLKYNHQEYEGSRPDATDNTYYYNKPNTLYNSTFYEVKATKSPVSNTRQIKNEIAGAYYDVGSGGNGFAGSHGLANLIIVTFAGNSIRNTVIKEATDWGVDLFQITPEVNLSTNEIRFGLPTPLNNMSIQMFFYNTYKWMNSSPSSVDFYNIFEKYSFTNEEGKVD